MEVQWELILFTTFVAWSAGLFGSQALASVFGRAKNAQMTAWIVSAVFLVVGGIAVFFHLQHWERIFNGFGHLTSGITQELIAIVILAVVAVVYLIFMRRSEDGKSVPKWFGWISIACAAALVVVMAHSYMMSARPVWGTFLWVAYVLGNALVLGPATLAVIMALRGDKDFKIIGTWVLVGALINLVCAVAYAGFIQISPALFTDVGRYFDPTHPTKSIADVSETMGSQSLLLWLVAVGVGALLPTVLAFVARKKGSVSAWKMWGTASIACVIIGALAMRVVFYLLGFSVFMFY